jgi:hypothetical protein
MPTPKDNRRMPLLAPEDGIGAAPVPPKPPQPAAKSEKIGVGAGFSALRVSLMPVDATEGKPDFRKRLMILAAVLVLETLLLGGVYLFFVQRAASQQAELQRLRTEQQQLVAAIGKQESETDELAAFAMQVNAVSERLDAHVHWTNLMTLLENYTMPEVRYDNFAGGYGSHVVTLGAVAPTFRDMAEQILLLRSAPMVRSVRADAGVSEIDETGQISGVKWAMVLDLDPAVWLATSKDKVVNPSAKVTDAAGATTATAPAVAEAPAGLDR